MSLKHFNKTQVLSSYNKERIIFLIGVVSIFFSSIISVFAANYLYSSSEVSFDNSSSGISSDNVQGAIDELYQNASDYSSLESRIGVLEGHWKNSPESYFEKSDGQEWLHIGLNNSTSGNRGINIYDSNNVRRGAFSYNASNGRTFIGSLNSSGEWGKGSLELDGNPVTVNGVDIMSTINGKQDALSVSNTSVNFTNSSLGSGYTTQTFSFYKYGRIVCAVHNGIVNNSTAGSFTLSGSVPTAYRPTHSVHVAVPIYVNNNVAYTGRVTIAANGTITYVIPSTNTREYSLYTCYISAS